MGIVEATDRGVEVALWVVPGASRSEIKGVHGDAVRVRVAAPPQGGLANDAVLTLLEAATGGRATIVSGHASRKKIALLVGVTRSAVRDALHLR